MYEVSLEIRRSSVSLPATDPWINLDGRLNAKAGNAQFPTLLDTYHPAGIPDGRYHWPSTQAFKGSTNNLQQPPWRVAGVDYPVGIYSNCTINTSTSFITETGAQNTPANGTQKSFRTVLGGSLPSGVSQGTAYFVVNASGNTYQVSVTSGGSPLTLGGSPAGVVALKIPVFGTFCMPPGAQAKTGNSPQLSFNNQADGSNNGLTVTPGDPITVDAYDLSFGGGYFFDLFYNGPMSINNCYFRCGTNLVTAVQGEGGASQTLNLTYCEVDGNGSANPGARANSLGYILYTLPPGLVQYCWFHNVGTETIAQSSPSTFQYCLTNSCGWGLTSDHMEMFSGQGGVSNYTIQFSTYYNEAGNGAGWPMDLDTSIIFFQTPAGVTSTGLVVQNNTTVMIGATGHIASNNLANNPAFNQGIFFDSGGVGGATISPRISSNYMDTTGIDPAGFALITDVSVSGATFAGNISLNSGATIVPNITGQQ